MTSTSFSVPMRLEKAASLWHIMQIALSLITFSASGMRSKIFPNGSRL